MTATTVSHGEPTSTSHSGPALAAFVADRPSSYNGGALRSLMDGLLGERAVALAPRCQFGPRYSRSTADTLADSGIHAGHGDTNAAERSLLTAEYHAGVRGADETHALIAAIEGRLL